MSVGERILLLLSRNPKEKDYTAGYEEVSIKGTFNSMPAYFPRFKSQIIGKTILDFGCGTGHHAVALAKNGAGFVVGIENNLKVLASAKELAKDHEVGDKTVFKEEMVELYNGQIDIAISINSMEHFSEPFKVVSDLKTVLKENGQLLIKFDPPWFSPYGSHTQFFTKIPWVNLFFSEKTVMKVRQNFREDGAKKYEDIEGGLNKMTIAKFERIVSTSGMEVVYNNYRCIKGFDFLSKIPILRELFITQVVCILRKV